jgi:lipoate---protein ligase
MFLAENLIRDDSIKNYFDISEPKDLTVVLGRSRTVEGDVFEDKCSAENVKIEKRISGGGTVLLAPGMLVWTLVVPTENFCLNQTIWFKVFSEWIIQNLFILGVSEVQSRGTSDITINNRKICGTSLYIGAKKVLYHGTLLIDFDPLLFDKYLKIPDRMPEYRNSRGHSKFVTTLKESGYNISKKAIISVFQNCNIPSEKSYQEIKQDNGKNRDFIEPEN